MNFFFIVMQCLRTEIIVYSLCLEGSYSLQLSVSEKEVAIHTCLRLRAPEKKILVSKAWEGNVFVNNSCQRLLHAFDNRALV